MSHFIINSKNLPKIFFPLNLEKLTSIQRLHRKLASNSPFLIKIFLFRIPQEDEENDPPIKEESPDGKVCSPKLKKNGVIDDSDDDE